MKQVLSIEHVSKVIKGKTIIDDLTLTVNEGEVFGLLGPNGAGKTTTIRMIVGLIKMTKGDIVVCGNSIKKNFEDAVSNIGAIVENPEMYNHLTGYQNLKQYARMQKGITSKKIDEVIDLVGLNQRIHEKVRTYSLGMKQRLGLAQSLLHDPKLLILDEPTNGLDPAGIREIRDHLRMLAKEKSMSIVVSSHLLAEMEMMCDRIAIIQHGKLTDIEQITDFVHEKLVTYKLETSTLESVLPWLQQNWNITLTDDGFVVQTQKDEIPKLLKQLIEANVAVYSAIPQRKTLEDRFLEVTNLEGSIS